MLQTDFPMAYRCCLRTRMKVFKFLLQRVVDEESIDNDQDADNNSAIIHNRKRPMLMYLYYAYIAIFVGKRQFKLNDYDKQQASNALLKFADLPLPLATTLIAHVRHRNCC